MPAEHKGLDVTIMGREFRVACPEGEKQALLKAVDYLDKKMREIREKGKVIGVERIAIMAALNISNELLSLRDGGLDVGACKAKAATMTADIDQALADQDKLF
jgi:cell division protein ZapA